MKPIDLSADAPWRERFRLPTTYLASVASHDPSRGLVLSDRTGVMQLYACHTDTGELHQITDKPAGAFLGGISPDGRYIYYLDDQQGNETGHFVRMPFHSDPDTVPEDISPDMPPYNTFSISQSLNGEVLGFQAANDDGYFMYVVPVAVDGKLGERQEIFHATAFSFGPLLNFDGDYALVATTEHSGDTDKSLIGLKRDASGVYRQIGTLIETDGNLSPVAFSPITGDARMLATTDASGFERPVIWDLKTGDRIDIPLPQLEGDIEASGWSQDGQRILLSGVHQAKHQLYVYDLAKSTLMMLEHPAGTYMGAIFMPGTSEIVTNWSDAVHPPSVIALDATTGKKLRTLFAPDDVPASRPWQSVSFTSTGGVEIQAWLAVPEGEGPFPTILHTHGGPTAVQTEVFSPPAQAWLDHGFAWLSINYRGSTTFGREFERAILGMLGHLEVDDMAAAYHWLVDNGIAILDQVLLAGRSYGGYLTLQALGRKPDLWAGGMAMVAIADWRLMADGQSGMLLGYMRALFGGMPDERPEQYKASSPITYIDAVQAPLLVIQGRNDVRCPAHQLQVYEQAMRNAGKSITVHWFDAGHAALAVEQSIEHQEMMLRWAYDTLKAQAD